MPAYVVLDIEVTDADAFAKYKERFVILEFPTVELGRAWWASAEYGPAKALRQTCARTEMLLIEGASTGPP